MVVGPNLVCGYIWMNKSLIRDSSWIIMYTAKTQGRVGGTISRTNERKMDIGNNEWVSAMHIPKCKSITKLSLSVSYILLHKKHPFSPIFSVTALVWDIITSFTISSPVLLQKPLNWSSCIHTSLCYQISCLHYSQRDHFKTQMNTCKSMADSCQCMAKPTTIL